MLFRSWLTILVKEGQTMKKQIIDASKLDIKEKVVTIKRVTKVVKGGRTFRFSALVVVGDGNGHVGVGIGKAMEIPDAIKKGIEDAKKNLIFVEKTDADSIHHQFVGEFGSARVLLEPAIEGTGVIAGSSCREILELAGVHNILTKIKGSRNKFNVARATIEGLAALRSAEEVAALRGKEVKEILS